MKHYKYLILGGGVAAGYAVKELVSHDRFNAEDLAVVSADDTLPYDRPPLSKDFLAEKSRVGDILINDENFYRTNDIDVYLKTPIERIYTTARTLRTTHGDGFSFDHLVIATGASPNQLDIPGAGLPQIHYLRTVEDSASIRQYLDSVEQVAIIGGGYIGLETAAICANEGKSVTMIFPEERLMGHRFFTPRLSAFFENALREKGVTFRTEEEVTSFEKEGEQARIKLESGNDVTADLVIVGIGVSPNVSIAKNSRIQVDDGVLTNEYLETNIPGIYALGDVANFYDVMFKKRRRTEHWQNAVDQGKYIARRLLGLEKEPFQKLRYFFSDVLDYSYEVWGEIADGESIIESGDYDSGEVGIWWMRDGRVVAALLMGRPDEEREMAQEWIREGKQVAVSDIPDVLEQQPA